MTARVLKSVLPFPHVVVEGFLKHDEFRSIRRRLAAQRFARKDADLFSFEQTEDLLFTKDLVLKRLVRLLRSKEMASFVTKTTGVRVALGKVDVSGFRYTRGNYLLCHDDGFSSRRIAYVLHLSTLDKQDGGTFALYSSDKRNRPTRITKRVRPRENTLLLFPVTNRSHHRVDEVLHGARYTITGWFHA